MDTTETYVKMCEKATEIQSFWKPKGGDYFLHDYRETTGFDHEQEKQIWGDNNEKWQHIEILCYKPMEDKNWFVSTADGESYITSAADIVKDNYIWLPHQDQLQEMIMAERKWETHPRDLETLLESVCYSIENNFTKGYCSYEQVWLAYVMSELYYKRWNGEDWIKIESK